MTTQTSNFVQSHASDAVHEVLLRLPMVLQIIPVSRATWYAGIAAGRYPRPVKIGLRSVAWRKSEIDALLQSFL